MFLNFQDVKVYRSAISLLYLQVAKNERPRLLTKANTQKKEDMTQAQILIDKAMSASRISETKWDSLFYFI